MSLSVQNITKLYGEQKALDAVNFEISGGEIVGFLGPNGAGKSTIMKIITGYIAPNEGIVLVNGMNIGTEILEIRKQIGYLPEHNPLYLEMYVKEYLRFVAKIYKVADIKNRVAEIIDMTGLQIEQHKKIGALSKGYRQRVGLAAALIHDPSVLILDEPTTGLDPNQIVEIRNLIRKVGSQKTVLLSTHIMQEVEAICDRVIIINQGKIVADNAVGQIKDTLSDKQFVIQVEFDKTLTETELLKIGTNFELKKISATRYLFKSQADIRADIFRFAVANKLILMTLKLEQKTLEEVFRELTR
jgi:ABC-2 type transport system ATP-binding protein